MSQVAVVVGAGGALGAACCQSLRERGFRVIGVGRDRARLSAELGDAVDTLVELDLAEPVSAGERLAALGASEPVDALIYNAGRLDLASILETSTETFVASWQVNTLGAFLAARAFAAPMARRGRGSMVFVGATASLRGGPRTHAFASAKHALRGLASSLAKELGPLGVHVAHLVLDGKVWSPRTLQRFADTHQRDCLEPRAVAQTICALIEQPRSAWTFEIDLRPDVEKWS